MSENNLHKVKADNGSVMKVGFLDKAGAVVSVMGPDAGARITSEVYSSADISSEIQYWGDNNKLPTEWREKIEGSTTAYPLIAKLVSIMFGRGLVYYKKSIDSEGNIQRDFSSITEVDEFIANNDIPFFLLQRMMDYKFCNNIFCEFILNNKLDKILSVNHLEAEFTRFGKLEKEGKDLKFKQLKYNGDWDKPDQYKPIPFLNRNDLSSDQIKKRFVGTKKFSFHSYLPSPGRTIYAFPPHGAIFKKNGWLDFANSVPEIMNRINDNAMNIKYHIRIPYEYWSSVNKDWSILDDKKRNEIIDKKLTEIENFLVGKANAGKAFYSHFATDAVTGKPLAGWEIITLDDKTKKDAYLTSVQEADIQISRALNADSSLANIQPQGGKMGAGSGSDKRIGFENTVNTGFMDTYIVTEPLRIVGMFNGWPSNLEFAFMHDIPTTLNENKSGVKSEI
jgi:hypothetical protein